jgi:hypothetical protein
MEILIEQLSVYVITNPKSQNILKKYLLFNLKINGYIDIKLELQWTSC